MDQFLDLLIVYQKYVLLGLMLLFLISLVVFITINVRMNKLVKYYRSMLAGVEGKNLEEMLYTCFEQSKAAMTKTESLDGVVQSLQKQSNGCLQKVGLIRFNAFEDVGGEMSFALALLDQQGNGFIISNLYGRQESHVYLRPVSQGKTSMYLLPEEQQALEEALKT